MYKTKSSRQMYFYLAFIMINLILANGSDGFNKNFILNGDLTSNSCGSKDKTAYLGQSACVGPSIVSNWFALTNGGKSADVTLLDNGKLYSEGTFYYEPTSYNSLLIPLNTKQNTNDNANDYQGIKLLSRLQVLKAGVYTLQYQEYFISPSISDQNNIPRDSSYDYNLFLGYYPANPFISQNFRNKQRSSMGDDNVLRFTFTVPRNYAVTTGKTKPLNLGLNSGTPFIALITPHAQRYTSAVTNFKLYISGCTDLSQNLDLDLGYLNDIRHSQICVEKDKNINCQYFTDKANSQNSVTIQPNYECVSCPTPVPNLVPVFISDSLTTPGCSDLLITGVDKYKKTILSITQDGKTYTKLTPHSCSSSYIASEGTLRIKDDSNIDKSGAVCIKSEDEIENIDIWEYDSDKGKYVPKECKGLRTLVQLENNKMFCLLNSLLLPGVKKYKKTSNVQVKDTNGNIKYTAAECQTQQGFVASSGKLRLLDNTTGDRDETGLACIQGADITYIQAWVLNQAKDGYVPAECISGYSLQTLADGVTKVCRVDIVIVQDQCEEGFQQQNNKWCINKNSDSKCKSYNLEAKLCHQCAEGYSPVSNQGRQRICQLNETCKQNQQLNSSGKCVNKQQGGAQVIANLQTNDQV